MKEKKIMQNYLSNASTTRYDHPIITWHLLTNKSNDEENSQQVATVIVATAGIAAEHGSFSRTRQMAPINIHI